MSRVPPPSVPPVLRMRFPVYAAVGEGLRLGARPRVPLCPPPRFTPAPVRQPRSSLSGLVSKATSPTTGGRESFRRSAARPAQSLTSRPPPPGGGRRPESAFGSHSSRDCQQAEEVVLSAAPPGYVPRCSTAVGSAPRLRSVLLRAVNHVGGGRRLEQRGAARRGPRRPTIQQHHCAPPSRVSRARTASRHPPPGAGRSPYQPQGRALPLRGGSNPRPRSANTKYS